jgi:hypothetical protein
MVSRWWAQVTTAYAAHRDGGQAAPGPAPTNAPALPGKRFARLPRSASERLHHAGQYDLLDPNEFRGIKRKLLQRSATRRPRGGQQLDHGHQFAFGEGKTFFLDQSGAEPGGGTRLQVLLIDADVIRPSVGNMFMAPPTEG